MAGKQFGEGKSIKISKASWKLLRARSVDLERPMTALVEEAVVAYLNENAEAQPSLCEEVPPQPVPLVAYRSCGWCGAVVAPERDTPFCSAACEVAHVTEAVES